MPSSVAADLKASSSDSPFIIARLLVDLHSFAKQILRF